MRYFTTSVFDKYLGTLPENRKKKVKRAISLSVAFFETGDLSHGLGMKPLGHDLWEVRAGLFDRVLFQKNKDTIEFIMTGTHDEIRRFLKNQ